MTTRPENLSVHILECPLDCPFLVLRTFLPNTLPFYCQRFETYLGVSPEKKIRRCAACRGVGRAVQPLGISLIESYIGIESVRETQAAFVKLDDNFQRMFVDLVSRTGMQIVLSQPATGKSHFSDDILKAWMALQEKEEAPEFKEFKEILAGEDLPFIRSQTKTLLMNLFQVLDRSEQEMLKNILQNPKQVEAFLDQFEHQPQDNDLLKNMRALLYDYDRQREADERQRQQQRQQEEMMLQLARTNYLNRGKSR